MNNKKRFHSHQAWVYKNDNQIVLRSYDTQVAKIVFKATGAIIVELSSYWDYSASTKRHVVRFLQEHLNKMYHINSVRELIKEGKITIDDTIEFGAMSND